MVINTTFFQCNAYILQNIAIILLTLSIEYYYNKLIESVVYIVMLFTIYSVLIYIYRRFSFGFTNVRLIIIWV